MEGLSCKGRVRYGSEERGEGVVERDKKSRGRAKLRLYNLG